MVWLVFLIGRFWMKKKMIITFANKVNYGAFLQAYSIQNLMGISSCLANDSPMLKHLVSYKRRKKSKCLWIFLALIRLFKSKKKKFAEIKKLRIQPQSVFSNKINWKDFDSFICGSDQVWNPNFIKERENVFFLDFLFEKAKRISYAASLGMKQWPKPFEQKVLPMLKRFDAISVREESAVSYLTSLGLKNVVCVCDPTILHKGDFYRKEFPYEKIEEEFSFVYRIREVLPDAVQSILLPKNREIWLSKPRRWKLPSVTQWLQNIDNAKFVVTDSFHCAVFCILFHKPFLVILNRSTGKGMNERFATLLGKTGLEYCSLTCEESSEEVLQKLNTPVNWEKVDAILEEWRTYSANWLKNALGESKNNLG